MSGIEQGIELTFKTIMKVKDDEINELKKSNRVENDVLYNEIHQRDNEIDQLKEEIAALKLDKKSHQDEILRMKQKSEIEVNHLRKQNELLEAKLLEIQNQNFKAIKEMELKATKVKENHDKDLQQATNKFTADLNALKNCHRDEKDVLTQQLTSVKVDLSATQSALHKSALYRCREIERIEKLKDEFRNNHIKIFKDILRQFGCRAARLIALLFPDVFDSNDRQKANGRVKVLGGGLNVYGFEFESCDNCTYKSYKSCTYKSSLLL